MSLPPGPRSTLLSTYKALRWPFEEYRRWIERYGDPMTIPALNGTVVLTGDPSAIKQIFSLRPDAYEPFAVEAMRPLVGGESVLLVGGSSHKRLRKLMAPPFRGERMRAYGSIMIDAAQRGFAALTPGQRFTVQSRTQAISLEVIIRAVFGVDERAAVAESERAMVETMEAVHPAFMFARALQRDFFGLGPFAKFTRARDRALALLGRQIDECRARPEGREDILAMLVAARDEDGEGLRDEEIRDQLVTLLVAGHETTAIALAWALYWLHRDDDARARLLEELDTFDTLDTHGARGGDEGALDPGRVAALPYLSAVCNETLRLNPIVPDIVRVLKRPITLKGFELPAGVAVCPAAALAHQDPAIYPEPERWRPERFLERTYSPFEFLPFGGGHRRCIGAAFAVYEMKLVLAALLREHRLRLVSSAPVRPVRRNITMAPEGGVEMIYEGRR